MVYVAIGFLGLLGIVFLGSVAYARTKAGGASGTVLDWLMEVQELLSTAGGWLENNLAFIASLSLMVVVGGTAYRGASVLRPDDRTLMQLLAISSVLVVFDGHRRLAAQTTAREKRQNKVMLAAILAPFCFLSLGLAALGLYKTAVCPDLVQDEAKAWAEFYHQVQGEITAKVVELQTAANGFYESTSRRLLDLQNQQFDARQSGEKFIATPEFVALPANAKEAKKWRDAMSVLTIPPLTPAIDRKAAADALSASAAALNQTAATAPPSAWHGSLFRIPAYSPPPTEVLSSYIGRLRLNDPAAWACFALSAFFEFLPFGSLVMRRKKVGLEDHLESSRQKVLAVRSVFFRQWRPRGTEQSENTSVAENSGDRLPTHRVAEPIPVMPPPIPPKPVAQHLTLEFMPPVAPTAKLAWQRLPLLNDVTAGEATPLLWPKVQRHLTPVGFHLAHFANGIGDPLKDELPLLSQLGGGPLVAVCLPVQQTHALN